MRRGGGRRRGEGRGGWDGMGWAGRVKGSSSYTGCYGNTEPHLHGCWHPGWRCPI